MLFKTEGKRGKTLGSTDDTQYCVYNLWLFMCQGFCLFLNFLCVNTVKKKKKEDGANEQNQFN